MPSPTISCSSSGSSRSPSAVEPTTTVLWRMGELAPVVGENFHAVRVIAEGVEEISTEVVTPASALVGSFGLQRDDSTGGIDLAPLRQATEIATTAEQVVTDLHTEVQSIDTTATIGQVSEGVDKFEKSWGELIEATQGQLDQKKS